MHRSVHEVEEERLLGIGGLRLAYPRDRAVGDVVGEVVPLGILVDVDRVAVLVDHVWLVEVGEALVEEAVGALETTRDRPRVALAGDVLVDVGAQVPLAHEHRVIAAVAERLRHGRDVGCELPRYEGNPVSPSAM